MYPRPELSIALLKRIDDLVPAADGIGVHKFVF